MLKLVLYQTNDSLDYQTMRGGMIDKIMRKEVGNSVVIITQSLTERKGHGSYYPIVSDFPSTPIWRSTEIS